MLKLTLAHRGLHCKVELNGEDISRLLTDIVVRANVGEITTATLTYSGAVVVEGEAGRLTLTKAEHFVTCRECDKVLRGERAEDTVQIADVSNIGADSREFVAPGS